MTPYKKDLLQVYCEDLPWEKLARANILVTGATGLIGGCLVDLLMLNPKMDYHVYASSRNEDKAKHRFVGYLNNPFFHYVKYDVMTPLRSDVCFDYIIHAASNATPSFYASQPVEVMKANIFGVSFLLEYGISHCMKRFLYISSGEVYGEGDGRAFSEDYMGYVNCATVRACYPSSKRAAETLCISYASECSIDVVIARPCHVYGPYFAEQDNRVYAQFIRNILSGNNIIMKSKGEQYRSWCYVVDCASALLHIILKGESGEAYNIADPESNVSIKNLAEIVAKIGRKKVVIDEPNTDEKLGYNIVRKSTFSIEKLKRLGWKPMTHIDMGLEKTINTILSNA